MNPIERHAIGLGHYFRYRPHQGPLRQSNATIASIFDTTVDVIEAAERQFQLDRAKAAITAK